MSTAPATPAPPSPTHSPEETEIRIVSHSTLFYWWPVWAIGFILGLLSLVFGGRMAIVPKDSQVVHTVKVAEEERTAIVLPSKASLPDGDALKLHVSATKTYGVIFATVLLLVILITNVPLRGMWSVVAIMTIIMLVIIFSLAGWWDAVLGWLYLLHIHINAAGYFTISIVLLIMWFVTFYFFDRQIYMTFSPG